MFEQERWLPVTYADFAEAYDVSDHGRIRTKARETIRVRIAEVKVIKKPVYGQKVHERILRPGKHPYGYDVVCLKCRGKRKMERVHKLVALAFIPNPLGLPMINHIDCNPSNNHYTNLEWCDQHHNMNYAGKMGRFEGSQAKLTWEKVALIRTLFKNGESRKSIAERFDVTANNVWAIVNNKTWKI